ncbi:MAG: glutamate--tRNA ligase [Clostridia bacterium]
MEYKKENLELAECIFPEITETIEDLEKKYPERNLPEGAHVTRFAPSPTGFLHTGALFTSLVCKRLAEQSNGIFYLRIEDTDRKREVEGSVQRLIVELKKFNIMPEEGMVGDNTESGIYGPYKQSDRELIYKICAKELIKRGLAYPCFCSTEDIDKIREGQEKTKIKPGYYGRYARCRNIEPSEAMQRIKSGDPYILRLRSNGTSLGKISYKDIIRGKIEIAENDQDIVIIKSDNLPTYHFAHVVDDHFMRTTTVVRGEEWIASVPIHLELFKLLGFKAPKYGHLPGIMKMDGGSKRKLSKRKDPEAAVSYFLEQGYEVDAVLEYLLGIINSDFEPWRRQNKDKNMKEFTMRTEKISVSGALFDLVKLNDVSKEYISRMNSKQVYESVCKWASEFNKTYAEKLANNKEYALKVFAVERDMAAKVRKDITKWSEVEEAFSYFYEDEFAKVVESGYNYTELIEKMGADKIKEVLNAYKAKHDVKIEKNDWFNGLKEIAADLGFCTDMKAYKKDPDSYIGNISHVAEIVRIAITDRKNTPDIYEIMKVLGDETVIARLNKALNTL